MVGVLDRLGRCEHLLAAEVHLVNVATVGGALCDDLVFSAATVPSALALDVLVQPDHLQRAILGACGSMSWAV